MRIEIELKSPNAVGEAIYRQMKDATQEQKDAMYELCSRWFSGGEYLTVVVDSEYGTIAVVPEKP